MMVVTKDGSRVESLTILLVFHFLVVLVKGILRPEFGIVWHSGISLVVVLGRFAKKSKMVARLKFYIPRDVFFRELFWWFFWGVYSSHNSCVWTEFSWLPTCAVPANEARSWSRMAGEKRGPWSTRWWGMAGEASFSSCSPISEIWKVRRTP